MKILVCGAGGFIGTHLVSKLKQQGHYVIGADLKYPEYSVTDADEFHIIDLRDQNKVSTLLSSDIDYIYQLAADMGGAGFIFTGENDADIMHNSASINLNILDAMQKNGIKNVLYTSSACIYPERNQLDPDNPNCEESSAYPADPDSEYGWEKLFSERLYLSYSRNYGINVRIARLHNVFGPLGSWNNGREKAPAALCRKVLESSGVVEVWGPGIQTRSFMYIDECIEGILRLGNSAITTPLNIGSARMININDLTQLIATIANKNIEILNVEGPIGVMGRRSDNALIRQLLDWEPEDNLEYGLRETYKWISKIQTTT
jgi:nucleoside-diphosphate-sugar epimerase